MEAILNFEQDLDVATLDRVVQVMYTSSGAEVRNLRRLHVITTCLHADAAFAFRSNNKLKRYSRNFKSTQKHGRRCLPFSRHRPISKQRYGSGTMKQAVQMTETPHAR